MNTNHNPNPFLLAEEEIDRIVEEQANDDLAWETPISVHQKQTAVAIPGELAAKAVFFASLHRETNVEAWLIRVIQERLELEQAAFQDIKADLARDSRLSDSLT